MTFNRKTIFLFDAFGAGLSFIFTGLILPAYSKWLGIPVHLLYQLALFPLAYGLYSLGCYFFFRQPKPWMLPVLILANSIYGLISLSLIVYYQGITPLGQGLLTFEILVLFAVIVIEWTVFKKNAR